MGLLAHVLGASGWLRTFGGTDVYLAARARHPRRQQDLAGKSSSKLIVLSPLTAADQSGTASRYPA